MASPKTFDLLHLARGTLALAALALVGVAPLASAQTSMAPPGQPLDSIVAVVNDAVVLASELDREVDGVRAQLQQRGGQMPSERLLRRQVLERLVVKQLQLQQADRIGIQITDDELDHAIADIAGRNKMTLEQLSAMVERQGQDYAAYREDIREEMLVDRVRKQDVERRVIVTPREVDQFLASTPEADDTEYDVSHILISLRGQATPDEVARNQERAEATYAFITEKGNEFAATATSYSDAPDALEGGALGWRRRAQLPTVFAEMVPGMKPGDVSKPIRSSAGFHIIKLNGVRAGQPVVVKQFHARHILIKTNQVVTAEMARAKAEELRAQIVAGADFAELAKLHSEDPGSKVEGGDLGWSDPGTFVPQFSEVMTKLQENEISPPFESPFGWHIVQLLGERDQDVTEQARRGRASQQLRNRKLEEQGQLWLQRLRDEAYMEIRLKG
jgi:peptidyl-prolyl cis-trans isomerase SurA